jgi:hypothetical protein
VAESAPSLLRIPRTLHTVDEVLGVAKQMNLGNIVILSEREDGTLVFLTAPADRTLSQANWMLDRMKRLLFGG